MKLLEYKTKATFENSVRWNDTTIKLRKYKYLEIDVLEAAIARCKYILSRYDDVIISFSGGKDSIVVLELMDMVRIEMGITKKLKVLFWDEELISDAHHDFLVKIYNTERFDFKWVCAPLKSEKFILGDSRPYIQWDVTREFVRTPPEFAIKLFHLNPSSEHDIFNQVFRDEFSNFGLCLGLRAAESLNRKNGVFASANIERPYEIQDGMNGAKLKPIYDWSEKDIFKFLLDFKVEYAPVYDGQIWAGAALRVATPFTNEGAKHLDQLKVIDPLFYDRLITVFPEMSAQERYYKHYDEDVIYEKYGINKTGILKFIEENLHGRNKERCLKQLVSIWTSRLDSIKNGTKPVYPLIHVFKSVYKGDYKRAIKGLPRMDVTDKMMQYEKGATD